SAAVTGSRRESPTGCQGRRCGAIAGESERSATGLVAGGRIALDQFGRVEVVLPVAWLVPLVEKVGIKRHKQSLARLIVLQTKHVFRLVLHFTAAMAMLDPDTIVENHHLPERVVVVELQRNFLAAFASLVQQGNAGGNLLLKG